MLRIENPSKLEASLRLTTAGMNFEIIYQRENGDEYIYRILRDGLMDCKMVISKNWNSGDNVIIRFTNADNSWILSTYELNFDIVSHRSKFLFWITEKFISGYK